MRNVSDYEPVIDAWLKQFAAEDGFQAGVIYRGTLVGMAGFHGMDRRNEQTSIGYWLAEEYQGKGIMTRVCRFLIRYAFAEWKLNRVEIRCGVENHKSRAIPERLGFRMEGVIRDGEQLSGTFTDLAVYGLLRRDQAAENLMKDRNGEEETEGTK
ncbi:ribosomal-protein-serine acetyltransferase [Melghirimyces profundicolus]|uniref:Ribosomal-protein-serine acetyltransferase n=1 Tax=Melghirimyces profundicolus TaxID=1242148 RepID=A0A2T6C9K1_9BACL|nr:ribosomal-protein-serine acetyltransferase [Melghirimyces profundicolus]